MIKLSERQMNVYKAILSGKNRNEIKVNFKLTTCELSNATDSLAIKGLIKRNEDRETYMVIDRAKEVGERKETPSDPPLKLREGAISPDVLKQLESNYKNLKKSLSRSEIARRYNIPRFVLNHWAVQTGNASKEGA
ncbi:hypothetical protein [Paenibacillus lutrae]|uniref:Uncharacterized protein n=1 Tax=Paenibacillus lutrae TaxID=2078573 RepID=A0A7X3FIL7_9BACL|nr:hypothetical protein [Paenibacillus lutrae]MVP00380.1 hypothetical protein [Paenibacillus lutrae]